MYSYLYHMIIPFLLSAFIVIIVTIIAERYGTKKGGIIGTLPSTIVNSIFGLRNWQIVQLCPLFEDHDSGYTPLY